MPEGDTVYKVAQSLRSELLEASLVRLIVRGQAHAERLQGNAVLEVRTYGKHLIFRLGPEWALRVHLGMNGSWRRYDPEAPPAESPRLTVLLETSKTILACLDAMEAELFPWAQLRWHRQLQALGPDLLSECEPDWKLIVKRAIELHRGTLALGELLLDQRVAAGLGNAYRSELPFLGPAEEGAPPDWAFRPHREHRFNPWTPIGRLSVSQLERLYVRGRYLLQANLGGWRRTTRFDRRFDQRPQRPGENLWVYGRHSEPCWRCGTPIKTATMGLQNRVVFWCSVCQPSEKTQRRP